MAATYPTDGGQAQWTTRGGTFLAMTPNMNVTNGQQFWTTAGEAGPWLVPTPPVTYNPDEFSILTIAL